MPRERPTHYNPPDNVGWTKCRIPLTSAKKWTTDPNDATCNNCVRSINAEARKK